MTGPRMKNRKHWVRRSLSAIGALALLMPRTSLDARQAPATPKEFVRLLPRETIQGKVSAKTDSSLTVDGKVIATTAATAFTKEGKPITLSDVQVGDKVKVTASKEGDGTWRAIAVEILGTQQKSEISNR